MATKPERDGDAQRGDGLPDGLPFVGRRSELELLQHALREPPAVVMIEGEAGIGKSRLARQAVGALSEAGGRVLTGFCHPLREPFPFGPVSDALRETGRWLPPVDQIPPTAGALASLLPDLAHRLPPPPARPSDARAEKYQLVQAVRTLLEVVGPAVLLVEDLHWADDATRELLLLLARDLPKGLSLVLTYRAEDLPPHTPVLGSTYRRPATTSGAEIHLTPLAESDIQQLAEAALGRQATAALGQMLFERSAGLPLVVEEDLLTLSEQSRRSSLGAVRDFAAELQHAEVPRALREAVTERLAVLSPAGTAIAEAAAVLAVPAAEPLLVQVAGLDPEQGSAGLIEALHAAVLHEDAPGPSGFRYAFRHAQAQQVAYQHVPAPRRSQLHRRAMEVLEGQSPAPLVQIAHHALALGDETAWLHRAEAAADQAIALGDTGTAAALLHQILARPQLTGDLRARAALALARIAANRVDYTSSAAVLRRILSDPQLPATTRGEIRLTLGLLMVNHAGDQSGHRELEQAIEELAGRSERAARAMVAMAMYEQDGAGAQSEAWLDRADRAIRDSPDEGVRAAVGATRLTLLARDGNPAVWALLDRLPRQADDPEVLRQTARALYNVGELAIELGHDRRAAALLRESRELAQHAATAHIECFSRIALLRLDYLAGHWADLEERFAALGAEFADIAMASMEQTLVLARLVAARGQHAQALQQLEVAAEQGRKESHVTNFLRAAALITAIRLADGSPAGAWETAAPAMAELRMAAAWARATGLVPAAVEAALACGERADAVQLAEDAERGLRDLDAPAAAAELRLARGLLLLDADPAAAAEQFHDAQLRWQSIGRPYYCAQATEHRGRALLGIRPHDAAAQLSEAAAGYDRLGATSDAARCRHTLREFGLARPSPRGRRGYGDQLSPRELDVARLLAQGASNQDIARALFLSPRTVEHHVARTLKKLGVPREGVREVLVRVAPD
ncbi:helix-turn-helix transcriptional regulator [Kitasatospora azatica]|uniref:helix-turn-helix transcriptional regulator n=1 Tax=Kitasatospora azatica TaxID=58347 RepID=UPI000A03AF50|nr:LuxR family transcriptional regulator [Kitasatospora azatica]